MVINMKKLEFELNPIMKNYQFPIRYNASCLEAQCSERIDYITPEGLAQLDDLFLNGSTGLEYRPAAVYEAGGVSTDERQVLEERQEQIRNRSRATQIPISQ